MINSILLSKFFLNYLSQITVEPQGSTKPVSVTGSPISSHSILPFLPFNTVTPNTYCITAGESPAVYEFIRKKDASSANSGGVYGNVRPLPGQWGWPASCGSKGSISSGYGYRWGALHDGVDIAGCGYASDIYAAAEGEVVQSAYKYDHGNYVTIKHPNGYYTIYSHMCNGCRYVKVGDYVYKGQVIGGMGQTGAATGVHLHFSIWYGYPYRGGVALNAMQFY